MLKIANDSAWQEAKRSASDELRKTYTDHKGRTVRSIAGSSKGGALWGAGMGALHGYMSGKDDGLKGKNLIKHVARKSFVGGVSGAAGGAAAGVGNAVVGHTIGRAIDRARSKSGG